ncbi:FHA domain protein [Dictyocaulus viviparus]|uniref:FHA domain protein n=1 Tax=Dictyocaulus viviparus TaxID=29172 RepID=A0A0D8Y997_DICVI|nr:FHA domain protein [Dictyocaulus viviparus]
MANPESRPTFTMLHERFQNFCKIPHLYVEDQVVPQAFIEMESQRDLLRELLDDTDDFTDPLNYFEMCENPETPVADVETVQTFAPRNVRRLLSTSSHRYQTDPMTRSPIPPEIGMDDGNYLIPNKRLLSEHATMYTPVIVNENGTTELVTSHGYYNEAKQKSEYYNDIVSTQTEKQQLQVDEDTNEEIEKESCFSGNVLVNDVVLSCGQKKELAFHDVITLLEGPQCIHLTFSEKRGMGIVDNTRPYITWESNSFISVRYLEEKKLFTIGSDRGCDISMASPYLAATHAELLKNVLKGSVQYAVRPAMTRRANLFVNGAPVSRKGMKNLVSGDVLTVSKDSNGIKFCFHDGEDFAHTTRTSMVTSSADQFERTVPSPSPQPSTSISLESKRRSRSTKGCKRVQQPDEVDGKQQAVGQEENNILPLNQLEANLTCSVCLNIFFKPIKGIRRTNVSHVGCFSIDPCNHKCCYSCVLSWLKQNGFFGKCPQCRSNISSIKMDQALNGIVESFLNMKPVLRRSREEIASIEASEAQNLNEYHRMLQYSLTADLFRSQPRLPFRRYVS